MNPSAPGHLPQTAPPVRALHRSRTPTSDRRRSRAVQGDGEEAGEGEGEGGEGRGQGRLIAFRVPLIQQVNHKPELAIYLPELKGDIFHRLCDSQVRRRSSLWGVIDFVVGFHARFAALGKRGITFIGSFLLLWVAAELAYNQSASLQDT